MLRSSLLFVIACTMACATDTADTSPQATPTEPAPDPGAARTPLPPKTAPKAPTRTMPWRWVAQGSSWTGARAKITLWSKNPAETSQVHLTASAKGAALTRIYDVADSELVWQKPLAPDLDPNTLLSVALLHRDGTIWVLLTRPDRMELQARAVKDGALLARRELGKRPAQFDLVREPQDVQLRVYLKGPAEVLDVDLKTLKTLAKDAPTPALARRAEAPWTWKLPDRHKLWKSRKRVTHKTPGAVYEFERNKHFDGRLARTFPARDVMWERKDMEAQTLMSTRGECLHVATASFIATGVRVMCLDPSTGKERWTHHVYGIGPIGHSKYANSFDMRYEGEHLVIQGLESSGRYVEVLDPKTGRELVNVRYF